MENLKDNSKESWMQNEKFNDWIEKISIKTNYSKDLISDVLMATAGLGVPINFPTPEEGYHITRYRMYQRINTFFRTANREGKVLEISGDKGAIFNMFDSDKIEYYSVMYPDEDIQDLTYPDNTFDYVICDQIIEHIESPKDAIKEIFRVLKPGGWALIASCFLDHIHTQPDNVNDYWRFTPNALRLLLKNFSRIYQCEGWGNREAFTVVMYGGQQKYSPVNGNPELERISSYNDPLYPLSVWAIAQK